MPRPSASDTQHGYDHSDSGGSEALSPTLTVLEGVGGTGDYYQHVSGAGDRHTLQVRFQMPFHPLKVYPYSCTSIDLLRTKLFIKLC